MPSVPELISDLAIIKEDVEGEKRVTRHILRKVTENEKLLLDVKEAVTRVENEITLLRADLPGIIANVVGPLIEKVKSKDRRGCPAVAN